LALSERKKEGEREREREREKRQANDQVIDHNPPFFDSPSSSSYL